ncbi:MAG: tyrosine-protein phosphatase [Verrucomicrobiota bacterium]
MRTPVRLPAALLLTALTFLSVVSAAFAQTGPRTRPPHWAAPIINSSLENGYRVSADLYRCEQPTDAHIADLRTLGIRSILNLRRYNTDPVSLERAGFKLLIHRLEADDLTFDDLVNSLRLLRDAPKPVLVHCWHGSDRTGSVVAAYRIVFENWTPAAALDEFRYGGFGYHERWFPNLLKLLGGLDAAELRRRVLAP